MDRIAKRLEPFLSYPFAEIDRAKSDASKRMRIIDFGVGDPDIPTPKEIQGALVAGLSFSDSHKYPSYSGEPEFRKSAARYLFNEWNIILDPDSEILALIGSKEGIAHLPMAILNPGDIACYPDPGYPVYKAGIAFADAKGSALILKPEYNFLPDLDDIPDSAKLVWLNYPNNPTGANAPEKFWRDAIEKARKMGFLLVNDSAYSEIFFDKKPIGPLALGGKDVSLELFSLSKPFSMCGYRVGFAAGNREAIYALSALKKNIDSGIFNPIQHAGKIALDNYFEIIPKIREIYKRRVSILKKGLNYLGWEIFSSDCTFYVWAKVPIDMDCAEFAKMLIEKIGVVVLPGTAMGKGGAGYVRFSLTLPEEDIAIGIDRLKKLRI